MRLGPQTRLKAQWDLNREPFESEFDALTH